MCPIIQLFKLPCSPWVGCSSNVTTTCIITKDNQTADITWSPSGGVVVTGGGLRISQREGDRGICMSISLATVNQRAKLEIVAQITSFFHDVIHDFIHFHPKTKRYITLGGIWTNKKYIRSVERVSAQCCCIPYTVIKIFDRNCNDC